MLPVKTIRPIPKPGDPGFFGAVRKHDIHTGIDLYTEDGAEVRAIQDGVVINIEDFTGPAAGSPWWEDTKSIIIESREGVIVYGELEPDEDLRVSDRVAVGDVIGRVKRVLRVDKGVTPTSMLHLEYYDRGALNSVWWKLGEPMPDTLRNPIVLLDDTVSSLSHTYEYNLILNYYGDRRAARSNVPLINHINEGDYILSKLCAPDHTRLAFFLHPLIQHDSDLLANKRIVSDPHVNSRALALAFEYRNIANQYLSEREISSIYEIELSPLFEVVDMLIADKIQNYKDFILHHKGTHPRSNELDQYFKNWLKRLGIKGFDYWFGHLNGKFNYEQ